MLEALFVMNLIENQTISSEELFLDIFSKHICHKLHSIYKFPMFVLWT